MLSSVDLLSRAMLREGVESLLDTVGVKYSYSETRFVLFIKALVEHEREIAVSIFDDSETIPSELSVFPWWRFVFDKTSANSPDWLRIRSSAIGFDSFACVPSLFCWESRIELTKSWNYIYGEKKSRKLEQSQISDLEFALQHHKFFAFDYTCIGGVKQKWKSVSSSKRSFLTDYDAGFRALKAAFGTNLKIFQVVDDLTFKVPSADKCLTLVDFLSRLEGIDKDLGALGKSMLP